MKKTHLMTKKLMAAGRSAIGASLLLLGSLALNSQAASVFFDFNSDPTTNGLLTIDGTSTWVSSGGVGSATNANDGYLQVTSATGGQRGAIVFADFDSGSVVQAFSFDMDVRIGNGTQPPADGFSINYVRASDPVLAAAHPATDNGVWATGPNCEANLPEEGTQTGISIGFDAWDSGGAAPFCNEADQSIGPDIIGVDIRVDGTLVKQFATPTLNGACGDPTSLQTGPRDGTGDPSILCWAHVQVVLDTNAVLNVYWKGTQILSNYQTTYFPSPGRLAFAGRTGGSAENHHVDNISITTIPASIALVGGVTGFPDGFAVTLGDSGSSVVNPATVTTTMNGSPVTPTVTKNGGTTTATYHGFPILLVPGTTNIVVVHAQDTNSNSINGTRSFVVPNYGKIPGSLAVGGVNTAAPGFRIMPWQSAGDPNRVYWVEEQIAGLHGTNNADLTLATDGGYIDYTTNEINFNITPASAPGGADQGNFQTNNGYSDSLFPGIPGLNGLNGSTAEEILGFIQFSTAGVYTMGVNSDDGFVVSVGVNPKDRLAQVLGQFDGGRGSSDTIFTFAVTNAGIYPIRLLWENGNGEAGNGANLEWFMVATNGTKILMNDPSVTNTVGVKVFYSGPALPAWLSHINPYDGARNTRADTLVAQLTDGSTTVNGGSISLKVNGSPVTTTVSKVGSVTTIRGADGTHLLTPGTNTATLVWSDSAPTTVTSVWSFVVGTYQTLDASVSAPLAAADLARPGFVLKVAQVDPCLPVVLGGANDCGDGTVNQVDSANAMIAGLYYPWYGTNSADPNTVPADVISGNSFTWYWSNAVDFAIVGSGGDFGLNYALPGIPSLDGVTANGYNSFSASFDSYVAFPTAGFYVLGVSSDDAFRLSQGWGVSRSILHVKGASVERDVAAVPSTPSSVGGTIWRAVLPSVPITAPIAYVPTNECPGPTTMNLAGKIALIDGNRCGADGADGGYNNLVAMCQARGAIAVIVQASPGWGTPEVMGGGTTPITIPALHINGFNGEKDWFQTNGPLVATIGGDTHLKLGEADFGKGMDHRDFGISVPAPGLYPLHLIYEQGGGGAGLEWTLVGPDIPFDSGSRILMNDNSTTGSLLSYRAITPAPKFTSAKTINGMLSMTWFGGGVLQETTSLNPPSWTDVNPQPPGDAYLVSAVGAKYYRLKR
jgi:hypothetical protein